MACRSTSTTSQTVKGRNSALPCAQASLHKPLPCCLRSLRHGQELSAHFRPSTDFQIFTLSFGLRSRLSHSTCPSFPINPLHLCIQIGSRSDQDLRAVKLLLHGSPNQGRLTLLAVSLKRVRNCQAICVSLHKTTYDVVSDRLLNLIGTSKGQRACSSMVTSSWHLTQV